MKDLARVSGLPIRADDRTGKLEFSGDLPPAAPVPRPLADLLPVLKQRGTPGPDPVYYEYPSAGFPADREKLATAGLAYHIAVIPPAIVGREFVKTHGCYRAAGPGGVPYPEAFEVLLGTALILCQQPVPGAPERIADAVVLELEAGQKAVIPPGYGCVVINPGPRALVLAGLVAAAARPLLEPYRDLAGACYYCTADEQGEPEFEENPAYASVPDLRMVPPAEDLEHLGLAEGVPLYAAAVRDPERFAWLANPGTAADQLAFPELDDPEGEDEEE